MASVFRIPELWNIEPQRTLIGRTRADNIVAQLTIQMVSLYTKVYQIRAIPSRHQLHSRWGLVQVHQPSHSYSVTNQVTAQRGTGIPKSRKSLTHALKPTTLTQIYINGSLGKKTSWDTYLDRQYCKRPWNQLSNVGTTIYNCKIKPYRVHTIHSRYPSNKDSNLISQATTLLSKY